MTEKILYASTKTVISAYQRRKSEPSRYKNNIPPSCFECDTPLEEAKPKSTSGEDIPDALNEVKMCCKTGHVYDTFALNITDWEKNML